MVNDTKCNLTLQTIKLFKITYNINIYVNVKTFNFQINFIINLIGNIFVTR